MQIDIVVYPGVDELDAIGPLEVLRNAQMAGAEFNTSLVTRDSLEGIKGSHGLVFQPDAIFAGDADVVVVAGGSWIARADVGAWGEVQRGDWLPLLSGAAHNGAVMASVCTGAMLLAHAGVIGTRRAVTHHDAWDDLVATGATLIKERVVDDGDLITAGGVTSGFDLAFWLVERFASKALADDVAERMEYPRVAPNLR